MSIVPKTAPYKYIASVISLLLILTLFSGYFAQANEMQIGAHSVSLGNEFLVDITADAINGVYGSAFDVVYDANIIEVMDADGDNTNGIQPETQEGAILNENGTAITILRASLENGIPGRLVIGHVRSGDVSGVDIAVASTLLSISFRAIAVGTTNISFAHPGLKDANNDDITVDVWTNGSVEVAPAPKGDVNGDGDVTAYDASLILQEIVGLISLPAAKYPAFDLTTADVTGDGTISALDAAYILQYAVGIIDSFPAPGGGALAYRAIGRQLNLQSAVADGQRLVTLQIDEANHVVAVEIGLAYNQNVMKVKAVQKVEEEGLVEFKISAGHVHLVYATSHSTAGQKRLATVIFEPTTLALDDDSGINIISASLNEGSIPVSTRMQRVDNEGNILSQEESALQQTESSPNLPTISLPTVRPTNRQIFVYSLNSTFQGKPLKEGDLVTAFDPRGILCGRFLVRQEGRYGYMAVYGDEPSTEVDEGAEVNDAITFFINGYRAGVAGNTPVLWTENNQRKEVDVHTWCQKIDLNKGWNSVNINLIPHIPAIEVTLESIGGKYEVVKSASGVPITYDVALSKYSDLTEISPANYWIKMNEPATLTITGKPPAFGSEFSSQFIEEDSLLLLFVDFWGEVTIGGEKAPKGTIVAIVDAQGQTRAQCVVEEPGFYGFLHLVTTTDDDVQETNISGSGIQFSVNGHPVYVPKMPEETWQSNGARIQINLSTPSN